MITLAWMMLFAGVVFIGSIVWAFVVITILFISEAIYRKIYHHYYPCEEDQDPVDLNPNYSFFVAFVSVVMVAVPAGIFLSHLTIGCK